MTDTAAPQGQHIGHGVFISYTGVYGQPDDVKGGLIVAHRHDDGQLCEGSVTFAVPVTDHYADDRPRWTVVSWEPLTLSPSISAPCGLHGFITDGAWVPA